MPIDYSVTASVDLSVQGTQSIQIDKGAFEKTKEHLSENYSGPCLAVRRITHNTIKAVNATEHKIKGSRMITLRKAYTS